MISDRQLFLRHLAQTSDFPLMLEIESAEGIYMTDVSGKKYIDLISGISVSNVGHRNPMVIKAIQDQLEKYMHLMVYGEFIQSPQVKLGEKLASLLPENLDSVYFVNSGSEAMEGALKLAKRYTRRKKIIGFRNAYHGSTHAGLSLISDTNFKNKFEPLLPDVELLNFNDLGDLQKITDQCACVIIEPIQGEAGVIPANDFFLKCLSERCRETGTLLIFDEIQTGFGRTGKLFAFEHYNIIPDILISAKAMGSGLPLGAFISSNKIMSSLKSDPALGHITTFGGNPVCCAAALAGLNYLLEKNLMDSIDEKEKLFKKLLRHPRIKQVRGTGLLIAVEFENYEFNKSLIDHCILNGLITDWFLFNNRSMRIAPPLIISETEIRRSCGIILNALEVV